MPQYLGEQIRECYLHAEECKRRAERERDPETRAAFVAMQTRWLSLAHNYEFAEQLSDLSRPYMSRKQ
jgi:hypothetical protein